MQVRAPLAWLAGAVLLPSSPPVGPQVQLGEVLQQGALQWRLPAAGAQRRGGGSAGAVGGLPPAQHLQRGKQPAQKLVGAGGVGVTSRQGLLPGRAGTLGQEGGGEQVAGVHQTVGQQVGALGGLQAHSRRWKAGREKQWAFVWHDVVRLIASAA